MAEKPGGSPASDATVIVFFSLVFLVIFSLGLLSGWLVAALLATDTGDRSRLDWLSNQRFTIVLDEGSKVWHYDGTTEFLVDPIAFREYIDRAMKPKPTDPDKASGRAEPWR